MNKIEMCAVEYLYHTRDLEFAKIAVNSVNKELSGVAYAVINNKLLKKAKSDERKQWRLKDQLSYNLLATVNLHYIGIAMHISIVVE